MVQNKRLSIVLPTYNRASYLSQTLDAFAPQMEIFKDDVSFIICNNASTDTTSEVAREYNEKYPYFDCINFAEHVSVGYSLSRAIEQARGEYVMLWGDDDLPAPFMINMILECINSNTDVSLIHFNRLAGYDDHIEMINKLSVVNNCIGWNVQHFNNTDAFLSKYIIDMTFMSSFVFKREMYGGG